MEPKKPNRHERRAALAIARRNRNARLPKPNPGPCGVRRYSLTKARGVVWFQAYSSAASDYMHHVLVTVDRRASKQHGRAVIIGGVMRQAQRVTR